MSNKERYDSLNGEINEVEKSEKLEKIFGRVSNGSLALALGGIGTALLSQGNEVAVDISAGAMILGAVSAGIFNSLQEYENKKIAIASSKEANNGSVNYEEVLSQFIDTDEMGE